MRRTRVFIDGTVFGEAGQGSATYVKGIYNALLDIHPDQFELFVAGFHHDSMCDAFPRIADSNFIVLKKRRRLYYLLKGFPELLNRHQFDFGHFQYTSPLIKNTRQIVTTHDVLFNEVPNQFSMAYRLERNFLFRRSLLNADIRLTVSDYSRQSIAKHYKLDASSISVTPNAVDSSFFIDYNKEQSRQLLRSRYGIENYILMVSRIEPRKNQLLLLDLFLELQLWRKGMHLVFAGLDTLSGGSLQGRLNSLPPTARNHVHWFTDLNDDVLKSFYAGARLFVYPSLAEGFGIPPLESAAMKVNTLCSNTTAMADYDFLGDNLFDPSDKAVFREKLLENLLKPKSQVLLEQISETIRKRYSWNHGAQILHQLMHASMTSSS